VINYLYLNSTKSMSIRTTAWGRRRRRRSLAWSAERHCGAVQSEIEGGGVTGE